MLLQYLGGHLEIKKDTSIARAGDYRPVGSGRNSHSSVDNGYLLSAI